MATVSVIMTALITAVIGPIAVEWVKKKLESKPKSTDVLQEAIIYNDLVNTQLEAILNRLDCGRIWISQFHNGGHFYPTGKSIQKFSIFYEKASPSNKSIQNTFKNIPVSMFPRPLAQLQKTGELEIVNFEKDDDYGLSMFNEEFGSKSLYMLAISDLDSRFIGVLHISFNEQHKLEHDEWVFVRQKVGAIGSLLTEYLYQTNNIKK